MTQADGNASSTQGPPGTQSSYFHPPEIPRIPADSAVKTLDKSRFSKTVPLARALVRKHNTLGDWRKRLQASKDLLKAPRIAPILSNGSGDKYLLLRPGLDPHANETWSPALVEGSESGDLSVEPWQLPLDYGYWSYCEWAVFSMIVWII